MPFSSKESVVCLLFKFPELMLFALEVNVICVNV
jgi:hypothetical protein